MAEGKQLILAEYSQLGRQDQALGWTQTHHGERCWLWRGWVDLAPLAGLPHSLAAAMWKAGAGGNVCRGDAGLWLSLGNRGCHFPPWPPPRKIRATRNYTERPSPFHFEIQAFPPVKAFLPCRVPILKTSLVRTGNYSDCIFWFQILGKLS